MSCTCKPYKVTTYPEKVIVRKYPQYVLGELEALTVVKGSCEVEITYIQPGVAPPAPGPSKIYCTVSVDKRVVKPGDLVRLFIRWSFDRPMPRNKSGFIELKYYLIVNGKIAFLGLSTAYVPPGSRGGGHKTVVKIPNLKLPCREVKCRYRGKIRIEAELRY